MCVALGLGATYRVTMNVPPLIWAPEKIPEIALDMDFVLLLSILNARGGDPGIVAAPPND